MDRREFIKNSVGTAVVAGTGKLFATVQEDLKIAKNGKLETKIAAYYIGAHVYTCVPRHVREDMEWMADKGTRYVFISVLEQDLFADEDAFVFLRLPEDTTCSSERAADPAQARFLIVVNKGNAKKRVDLLVEDTALAGCSQFRLVQPTTGNVPVMHNGTLTIEEPAESMTLFEVR